MRRAGTIGFVFLWLLTLVGGPLSRVAQALPESVTSSNATRQCKMSHNSGKACCCGGENNSTTAAKTGVAATYADCHCSISEAPLPPVDTTPRVLLALGVVIVAPALCSVPPIPTLERVVSPHVGTLAPPLQSRPPAPDIGRAPPASF